MPKNMFDDIKPITRVPKPQGSSTPRVVIRKEIPYTPEPPRRSSRYGMWYLAGACIIGLLFALSFLFEQAVVTVTPHRVPVQVDGNETFTAVKDASEGVAYTIMTLEGDEIERLPGVRQEASATRATGTVVIYNAFRSTSYNLVAKTRLQSPDGRIYRTDTAVTIPGYTGSGSSLVPGSKEVRVTADTVGEAGNIEQADFSIPGLAGTPSATKIYARSKTPISGGVSGTVYAVDPDTAEKTAELLLMKLEDTLLAKTKAQVPEGYVLLSGATEFTQKESSIAPYSQEPEVPITVGGTLTAYLLKEDVLSEEIARRYVSQYDDSPVLVSSLETFSLVPKVRLTTGLSQFDFVLSGVGEIVWQVQIDTLAQELADRKKRELSSILEDVSAIDTAEVTIRPFWKMSFPDEVERIKVVVK